MAPSVANYDAYSRSEWNWILGRFIVPVARLGEFEETFAGLPAPTAGPGFTNWRLSALLGSEVVAEVAHIREFNARIARSRSGRRAVVESVEVKVASSRGGQAVVRNHPGKARGLFRNSVVRLQRVHCGDGKLRAQSQDPDGRRDGRQVPRFRERDRIPSPVCGGQCALQGDRRTAPSVRSVHRFTYQPESPSGIMHGFVNVFLAAAFLWAGMETQLAVQLLDEQSAEAFHFDLDGIGWRQHRLSRHEIAAARRNFAVSFGSCSFTEPIDDLRSLHLL